MTKKLVLAMVDNTGMELTGRLIDCYGYHRQETKSVPEAKACLYSDYTLSRLSQLKEHIAKEASSHEWIGFFILDDTVDVLTVARNKALKAYRKAS